MMKILFLFILKLFLSCTSNPFWNDPETEQLTLSGTIFSENNTMGTPISVWLETFDRYTTTDENGNFSTIGIESPDQNHGSQIVFNDGDSDIIPNLNDIRIYLKCLIKTFYSFTSLQKLIINCCFCIKYPWILRILVLRILRI